MMKIQAVSFANSYNFETGVCDFNAQTVKKPNLPSKPFSLRVIICGKSKSSLNLILSSI